MMNTPSRRSWLLVALLALLCSPSFATVTLVSMRPSHRSPQTIGVPVTWTVIASDSNSGPLTFQFNVAPPGGSFTNGLAQDFKPGTLSSGVWTSQPFVWYPASCANVPQTPGGVAYTCQPVEGVYQIEVVVKDFTSGETASQIARFQVTPLATGGSPVVVATANPLVALFSSPSCAAGSSMRISFQEQSGATPASTTNWISCHPPTTMNFEVAGLYPSTAYQMFSQTQTNGNIVNGSTVTFTTGALPGGITFPTFNVLVPPGPNTDTTDGIILHSVTRLGGGPHYPDIATDLAGNVVWYYFPGTNNTDLLTRPLTNGTFMSIQGGQAWTPLSEESQLIRQIDLAGNVIRETNTGVIQQQLLAMGSIDGGPCNTIPQPAPIGSACLGAFHHDAIQTLANGYSAVIADVERIFPAGMQGDSSGLPVDIIGDMFVVLDANWQVAWYFDTFEHAGGAPQLDINRAAILGETCGTNTGGCPPIFLLGSGIAPKAHDWLHANSIYYWPLDSQTGVQGDLIWSSRHQDWVMKIDYQDGAGTGNILWRMGQDGDFTFKNITKNPWPWFSHQHEVAMENYGAGPLSLFDNGNTRVSPPPLGLGKDCGPNDCKNRGMVLNVDESSMQVVPVLSQSLGFYSPAMGSAQLLSNGNYFFLPAIVAISAHNTVSYSMEILPRAGKITGTTVLNIQGPESYRSWQMPTMYAPPIS
jgi:arylsulfate sulfotransferase